MNFSFNSQAIATTKLPSQLKTQIKAIVPETIPVRTPQRRANYNDKARLRRSRLKEMAFVKCGWKSTAGVKRYLRVLGIKLDLRLTSAWAALIFELKPQIDAAKAIVDALEKPATLTDEEMLEQAVKEGAITRWEEEEGLFWIWVTLEAERELVTSTGLTMFLRGIARNGRTIRT